MPFIKFSKLRRNKVMAYYIFLIAIIIILAVGTVVLRGRVTPKTSSTVGDLSDVEEIVAKYYQKNSTKFAECNVSILEHTNESLLLRIEPPANEVLIYMNQSVLDSDPNLLNLKIRINGSEGFAYELVVEKSTFNSNRGFYYATISDELTLTSSEYKIITNFQTCKDYVVRNGSIFPDRMKIFVVDNYHRPMRENLMEQVEIDNLAFVKEEEGRMPPQALPLDPLFILLSIYALLILFFLPVIFLKKRGRTALYVILISGFLLRAAIAPFTSHNFDVLGCKHAVRTYYEEGKLTLFSSWTSPPTWFFILIGFYAPYAFLRTLGFPDFRVYYQPILSVEVFFIKLPLILSDVLSSYLIYKISRKQNLDERSSRMAAATYIFNPFSIFISSIWGMFDSLAVAFTLLGLYFFLNKRFFISSAIWGLGVKWYSLMFIPFLSVIYFQETKRKNVRKIFTSLLIFIIGFGIFASTLIIPHLLHGDTAYLEQVLSFRLKVGSGGENYKSTTTFFGPTIWRIFEKLDYIHPFPNLIVYTFSLLYTTVLIMFFVYLRKTNFTKIERFKVFNNFTIVVLLLFYLTYPQLTPQCALWLLPPLIFAYFLFHQIDVIPLAVLSLFLFPYLNLSYFIIGFSTPYDILIIHTASTQLECLFGGILFSVAVSIFLKLTCPRIYEKLSVRFKKFLNLRRLELFLLYLGLTVFLFLQVIVIYFASLPSLFIVIPLVITISMQTVVIIAIDKTCFKIREAHLNFI